MKLNIIYNIKFELERVLGALQDIEWLNQQGYKVYLPKNISKSASKKEILENIKKEFHKEEYKNFAKPIFTHFKKNSNQFKKELEEIFQRTILSSYNLYLTNYGTYGSYNAPNRVILNINTPDFVNPIKSLYHEIVHTIIEKDIIKYQLLHWEKERIVDLIMNSSKLDFLNMKGWQGSYNGAEKYIDKLFNEIFFKDQELFFKSIEKTRLK